MPEDITGGDLYHLWRVSDVHLPRIADVYYDATRLVGGAETTASGGSDADAYRAGVAAYPGASILVSPIGTAWAGLRDEMQSMYGQIGGVILAAAEGVRKATQDFVTEDMVNADKLNKYKNDPNNHNQNDPASNPPAVTADDNPGTPSLPANAQG
jgi:hypothetical protein